MLLTFTVHSVQPAANVDINTSKISKTRIILLVTFPQTPPQYLNFCK